MTEVGYGQVRWQGRPGISEDQVFAAIDNPLLLPGEVGGAEETGPFPDFLGADGGRGVHGPAGVEDEMD